MPSITREAFIELARCERRPGKDLLVPISLRLLSDQLTPVVAYRRLVAPDERTAPSFLLESVVNGDRQGRHSILAARPDIEVIARKQEVQITDHCRGTVESSSVEDPLLVPRRLIERLRYIAPAPPEADFALPECALGGWFGFASYDTVRYAEPDKLSFDAAPPDDRELPDLHFAWYSSTVVFDHVDKIVHVIRLIEVRDGEDPGERYDAAIASLGAIRDELESTGGVFPAGRIEAQSRTPPPLDSNVTREQHAAMVARAKEYIRAGDIFQVVVGQRFERRSEADPFDVYRCLRAVNPSPYMVYLQARGCILVASSPEILCRVRKGADAGPVVTNRPLAGTRKRGATPEEDAALERELLSDQKELAEHVMLVDLGRNDVGRVSSPGSVRLEESLQVERYSHVMHISSTVTGRVRPGLDCWDALRAALPVGTISGAPKIRAMQIIDELEPIRRGPYGGGIGYVAPSGDMDIALALRTIVCPTAKREDGRWTYHLQAAGGIVADSQADAEFEETVNKAAALARAIELAELAFDRNTQR